MKEEKERRKTMRKQDGGSCAYKERGEGDDKGYQTEKQPGQILDQFMALPPVFVPLRRLLSLMEEKWAEGEIAVLDKSCY